MCRSGNTALQAQGKDSLINGFGVHSRSLQTSASGSSSSSRPHQLAPPLTVADPGGVRGVQMHPPFEGLPSRVLSKSAQT